MPSPPLHPGPVPGAESPPVACALRAVYDWSYEPEVDELRTLYANALERQWVALRDLDWERELDPRYAVGNLEDPLQFPVGQLRLWQALPEATRRRIATKLNAFLLSQFLHGEQGALMVAAQLVNAVPDMDAKFYASTQTLDEARHVEVFSRYVEKLDRIYAIDPVLKSLLDDVLATEDWTKKLVGMQIVLEGLALASFRNLRRQTEEPLLKELLRRVSQDEARHTGYGVKYTARVLPTLDEGARRELEDFAFEATRRMMDQRTGGLGRKILEIFAEEGADVGAGLAELATRRDEIKTVLVEARRERGYDPDPVRGFILPTLARIGLYNERMAPFYRDLLERNLISGMEGSALDGTLSFPLPENLEAWVEETGA